MNTDKHAFEATQPPAPWIFSHDWRPKIDGLTWTLAARFLNLQP